jgi:hypothetical protein
VIEIRPALPVEQKPIDPRDRIIDLVAMKEHAAWHGTDHSLDFWTRHDIARAWALQRDHQYDKRTWTEVEE